MTLACNIVDIGVFGVCEVVTTEIIIDQVGSYFIGFNIGGIDYFIPFEIEQAGDPVVLDMSEFPAYREIIFRIYDENEDEVIFENIVAYRIITDFSF